MRTGMWESISRGCTCTNEAFVTYRAPCCNASAAMMMATSGMPAAAIANMFMQVRGPFSPRASFADAAITVAIATFSSPSPFVEYSVRYIPEAIAASEEWSIATLLLHSVASSKPRLNSAKPYAQRNNKEHNKQPTTNNNKQKTEPTIGGRCSAKMTGGGGLY